ncbi:Hypothetical protein P9515_07261 [Prochlorococcus marinus str. MIT 9515]|uniref:Oxidoreductase n=1 Tax=Prochlorococcus marinus (strain MIT 9515) TaxID=167542 RepID=A2BVX4_PROM5|nr:Gfo/Idh/MocA family oxidoreductase [Prochlorococcus marinus]ABM71935.1 Hypothetical protein P9515_07261 [Prochlorococcus marinus str. MIT 9515]
MRFGIIGGGFGYDSHFEALKNIKGIDIVGIADSGSGRLLSKLTNSELYFNSIESLIKSKPNVITIATPPCNHFNLISKLAQSNIHIVCEKPFCISSTEGLKANSLIEKFKLASCINFQYRFEPGIQFLKSKINDQDIDNIKSVEVIWLTSGRKDPNSLWTWRNDKQQGGGVINAFLIHIIDLIQWLLNCEINDVVKSKNKIIIPYRRDNYSNVRPVTAEDFTEVEFILKNNILASSKVSNCNATSIGLQITINRNEEKLIFEHKPPFRACDQSVFVEKENKKISLFNASNIIPTNYEDTRTFSLRELYKKFILSVNGASKRDLPSFKSGYQVKKIIEKINNFE